MPKQSFSALATMSELQKRKDHPTQEDQANEKKTKLPATNPIKAVCILKGEGEVGDGRLFATAAQWADCPDHRWVGRSSFYLKLAGSEFANPFKVATTSSPKKKKLKASDKEAKQKKAAAPKTFELKQSLELYRQHLLYHNKYHSASVCLKTLEKDKQQFPPPAVSLHTRAPLALKGIKKLGCVCKNPKQCHAGHLANVCNEAAHL